MSVDGALIDRIVAGVLTQIGGGPSRPAGMDGAKQVVTEAPRHGAKVSSVQSPVSSELRVCGRVITAAMLADRTRDNQIVRVDAKAIVTPAAWDVIRSRNLHIQRGDAAHAAGGGATAAAHERSSATPLLIVVQQTEAVARVWEELQGKWRRELVGCPDDAAKLAIAELSRGGASQVAIVADQPQRAACLANRHESVKAVAVRDVSDVAAIHKQLRANLWCINPSGKSWFEIRRLLSSLDPRP